jgi:hypothetical protein
MKPLLIIVHINSGSCYELLLISIISSGSQQLLLLMDQQRHTCNSSETISDGSYEPLQMTFSIVVYRYTHITK